MNLQHHISSSQDAVASLCAKISMPHSLQVVLLSAGVVAGQPFLPGPEQLGRGPASRCFQMLMLPVYQGHSPSVSGSSTYPDLSRLIRDCWLYLLYLFSCAANFWKPLGPPEADSVCEGPTKDHGNQLSGQRLDQLTHGSCGLGRLETTFRHHPEATSGRIVQFKQYSRKIVRCVVCPAAVAWNAAAAWCTCLHLVDDGWPSGMWKSKV